MQIELKTGLLNIDETNNNLDNLNKLVGYGSRINLKRGFLFVSRVLGKHIPTKPSIMQKTYIDLANLIKQNVDLTLPTLVIGFAETATALGNGVYDALDLNNNNNNKKSFYIHSTRYKLDKKIFFNFYEEHCHAPSHIFYYPLDKEFQKLLPKFKNVILVDDEVSTGNTANNFVNELKKVLPNVTNYYLTTILNWTDKNYDNFKYISLFTGKFNFQAKNIEIDNKTVSESFENKYLDDIIPLNFGRFGIDNHNLDFDKLIDIKKDLDIKDNKKILVLGTSEFMYPPYLLAKYLENNFNKLNKIDIYFQATTRSPVNIDGEIKSKISFKDNYFENIDNFLYNVVDKDFDKILICYETKKIPSDFTLKSILQDRYNFNVQEIFFN
jgi:adenine/guanine phosphoribosyltransferase-like PRPP-binding protein